MMMRKILLLHSLPLLMMELAIVWRILGLLKKKEKRIEIESKIESASTIIVIIMAGNHYDSRGMIRPWIFFLSLSLALSLSRPRRVIGQFSHWWEIFAHEGSILSVGNLYGELCGHKPPLWACVIWEERLEHRLQWERAQHPLPSAYSDTRALILLNLPHFIVLIPSHEP